MEYALSKKSVSVCDTVFEGNSEQPVDLDFTLPDYCPDIEKILKCTAVPFASVKSLSGGKLSVEGTVSVSLLYLDSRNKTLRRYEHTSPFSCSFTVKGNCENAVSSVSFKTEYINCRALTPRRLDIHGAFTVSARIIRKTEQEIPESVLGDDIEQKISSLPVSVLSGISSGSINLSETLDIGRNRPAPQAIIRTELSPGRFEVKTAAEKLLIKGEALLKILYVTDLETGELDSAEFNIPINETLDAGGMSEKGLCDMELSVQSYEVSLKSDFDDDSTLIGFEAKLSAIAATYTEDSVRLIDDAYSRAYELNLTYKQLTLGRIAAVIDDEISEKGEISLERAVSEIIDICAEDVHCSYEYRRDEGALAVRGRLNCCILGRDENGDIFYTEKSFEFGKEYELSGADRLSCRLTASPLGVSYRISGESTLEVNAGASVHAVAAELNSKRVISEAASDEEQKRERDKTAALTIYYADAGENLWSIARSYCTSVEAIKLQNDLTDDIISARGMILIPM